VLRTVNETSIASSYKRGFPPIPPVGITIGPVGKLRVAEPEAEAGAEEAGTEILGSEIEGREEPLIVGTEEAEDGNEMEILGLVAWELDTPEELGLLDTVPVGADAETFTVANRLLEGAAGADSSNDRFFFPYVLAFLTERP